MEAFGTIKISLFGEKRDLIDIEMTSKFEIDEIYTTLLTYPKDLGPVTKASVNFTYIGPDALIPSITPKIKIENIEIIFMSNIEDR